MTKIYGNELKKGDKIYFNNSLKSIYKDKYETVIEITDFSIITNKNSFSKDNYFWITNISKNDIKKNGINLSIKQINKTI